MSGEFSGSVDQRIEQAFRTALARKPTTSERQQLRKVFEAAVKASGQEADGFVDVATVILNLYETIHRG
jgi:succinylarginine dihydrolase